MWYAIISQDVEDSLELRAGARHDHLARLNALDVWFSAAEQQRLRWERDLQRQDLQVADVARPHRKAITEEQKALFGIDKLNVVRSDIPAVTHVDYSARVQTVDETRHGRYYKLLKAFEQNTGSPVVINTSFNVRGEPIVCSPEHAYRCFMATNMDVLVLERCVLLKQDQPHATAHATDEYLATFALD